MNLLKYLKVKAIDRKECFGINMKRKYRTYVGNGVKVKDTQRYLYVSIRKDKMKTLEFTFLRDFDDITILPFPQPSRIIDKGFELIAKNKEGLV